MKVMFTIDTLAQGGAEQSTLETIRNFSKSVEPIVVYFYSNHRLKDAFEQINSLKKYNIFFETDNKNMKVKSDN